MKDPALKDIPVVMMSANEENEFISASLSKGAKDYIMKPLRTAVYIKT
jgi:PleD family two-component response regulator